MESFQQEPQFCWEDFPLRLLSQARWILPPDGKGVSVMQFSRLCFGFKFWSWSYRLSNIGIAFATLPLPVLAQGALPGSASPGTSSIEGVVSGDAGPAMNANVAVYLIDTLHGRNILTKQCPSWTNTDGHYSCLSLPAGSYLVVAEDGSARPSASVIRNPAVVFHPGVQNLNEATTLSLREHETQTADIALKAEIEGYSVSGTAPDLFRTGTMLGEGS